MKTEAEIRKMREILIQEKREYFGHSYEIWVALMNQLNSILQIDTGNGPITGGT